MSKLLVSAIDQVGDQRYKMGDIVCAYADAYQFQSSEGLPNFWQFTVLNLTDSDNASFIEAVPDVFVPSLLRVRRKRFIDITKLSQQAQNSLAANGTATVLRLGLLNALTLKA